MTTGGKAGRGPLLLVLTIAVLTARAARSMRALAGGRPAPEAALPAPVSRPPGPGHYLRRALAAVTLAAAVIVVTDWLGSAANDQVTWLNKHWWGEAQESPWMNGATHGVSFLSRSLTITIKGDELTAEYKVTALASSLVTRIAESDGDTEAGDDLVDNLLGQVSVGEFHYGVTGHQLQAYSLTFNTPQVQIAKDKSKRLVTTLDVYSAPFRLNEHRQQITVTAPATGAVSGAETTAIQLNAPAVQLASPVLVKVGSVAGGTANLQADLATMPQSANASFTVTEGGAPVGWFDGLRAAGGITLPIADPFLDRLAAVFNCGLFLWAFCRARRKFPGNRLVSVTLKATGTVVAALAAVAVLGLADDISSKIWGTDNVSYLTAGPLGLLVGGAAVIWPAACWRARSGPRADPGHANPSRGLLVGRVLVLILVHLAIAALYLARLDRLNPTPLSAEVVAGTVLVLLLVPLLVRALLGPGPLTWVASAGLLGAVFVAACSWPLLYTSTWWYSSTVHSAHVNPGGKWTFVAVAVLVAAGLCVMWAPLAWTVLDGRRSRTRVVRLVVAGVLSAVIIGAIVPDAVSESGVANPHDPGLAPADLFSLFDNIPQLLVWLLLGLAIVVVMRLPARPDTLAVLRDLALPIAVMILYWDDTWLYIPVSIIVGILLIRWLVMPRWLIQEAPPPADAKAQVNAAVEGWRRADFVAGQQQALAAGSTDALRQSLLAAKGSEFGRRLARLTKAQDDLAAKRDDYRQTARTARIGAFSHRGQLPDPGAALVGAVAGTILGVVPAVVSVLTTPPPSAGGSYPVLGFFGSTAWDLLTYTGLGWLVGYFLPLIHGDSGVAKALWVFIVGAAASIPDDLVWNDSQDWTAAMVNDLELLVFLVVLTVIVCDLRTLQGAKLRPADWVRVQNWRFVASWSAALLAAIGTIVITFATTTVTDLSQQLTPQVPSNSSSANSASNIGSSHNSGSNSGNTGSDLSGSGGSGAISSVSGSP
jgi:hypothetical protein